ncbi:MAG: ABC transporter ATP-binding protein [Flavobacteriaceae bacterium]|jgi:peptide/nickel transport system ATP-binding protein|nr:ABC transporter ATP-binding protein [Flavobacteriaceae bacterium]
MPEHPKPIEKKKPLLDVRGLSLSIEGKLLLSEVSLQLSENEILALVGESGSGKSLLALSMLGLQPKKAEVAAECLSYNQQSLLKIEKKDWQKLRGNKIGMVFQEPQSSLNPSMRCGKQLTEVLQQHTRLSKKAQREKIREALTEVQLPDPSRIYNAYPHEISGGQKQRVMIAMALLCHPQLLIADEPTTALDVTVQKEIIELLKGLQKKRNMSVLFISHDLALVKQLADRVMVMYQGEIVEQNLTQQLFEKPKEPYTRGLLFARPSTEKRLLPLPTLRDYQTGTFKTHQQSSLERSEVHKKIYVQQPILVVEGIEKIYQSRTGLFQKSSAFQAVSSLSFSIFPKETLGLVGESGCGKSTLAKALIYLDPPTKGRLYFKGKLINPRDKKMMRVIRQKIQFVFQDPYASLHPLKKVGNVIEEVLEYYSEKSERNFKDETFRLLNQVGLSETYFNRFPHQLSGGQRQRVVIARALASNPELLICDESVAALDISVQAQVLNLLNRLKKELGLSYLFISHDLAVVKYMSDRVMVMQHGQLVELQEADALYKNPQSPFTQKLINAIP